MTPAPFASGPATPMPRMLSINEVAAIFGRAPRTIRSWVARGLLKPVRVGHAVFIPEAQVDALMGLPEPAACAPADGPEMLGNSSM